MHLSAPTQQTLRHRRRLSIPLIRNLTPTVPLVNATRSSRNPPVLFAPFYEPGKSAYLFPGPREHWTHQRVMVHRSLAPLPVRGIGQIKHILKLVRFFKSTDDAALFYCAVVTPGCLGWFGRSDRGGRRSLTSHISDPSSVKAQVLIGR